MQTRLILAVTLGLALPAGIYACQDTFPNELPTYYPDAGAPTTFDAAEPDASDSSTVDAADATVHDGGADADAETPDGDATTHDASDGEAPDASDASDAKSDLDSD